MRLLSESFPEFAWKLDEIDELYRENRSIDEKTYQFICLALSIKNRSAPCVKKHFKGALEAGASMKEIAYIMPSPSGRAPVRMTAGSMMSLVTTKR